MTARETACQPLRWLAYLFIVPWVLCVIAYETLSGENFW